jgi:8-oxo-dGTP diphosphatase
LLRNLLDERVWSGVRLTPMQPSGSSDVVAAGAVVSRKGAVLLVHRPRYDDWSFPKGKLDRGEHATTAAVREVAEETGLDIRLGPPLADQRYPTGGRMKTVHYWTGRVVGDHDVSGYQPNHEIDAVEWVPWEEAAARLTYPHDRDTLAEARPLRRKTRALVVLRHGDARSRKAWREDDRLRPLVQHGALQAQRLVPVLAAYDVTTVVSSSSTRCVDTVAPYCHTTGWQLCATDDLSEEDATTEGVVDLVDELLDLKESAVVCTHRPVLPTVMDAAGVPPVPLEAGGMVVVHHRRGKVVATEVHDA